MCTVSKLVNTSCGASRKRRITADNEPEGDIQLHCISTLTDDISHVFNNSYFDQIKNIKQCQNVTLKENWLIQQRLSFKLKEMDTVCNKHRYEFVNDWNSMHSRSTKCKYPGHLKSKQKGSRKMTIEAIYQTELLFSSPAKDYIILIGSTWCNDCRLNVHPEKLSSNKQLLENIDDLCQSCFKIHNRLGTVLFTFCT